jgi:Holliday junction resolvase RusA-like endonuclease
MVLSSEARTFKRKVKEICENANLDEPFGVPVHVKIRVYRPRKTGDLDNTLKAILDSLNGIVYVDDRQIISIYAERHDDKSNPRAEIEVLEAIHG